MEEKHFLGKVSQKVLITFGDKILVQKGIGDEVWEFAGGHLHAEEEPQEGLIREVEEELGLKIENVQPLLVKRSFHRKTGSYRVLIFYTARALSDTFVIDPQEVEEAKWVSKEELKDLPWFDDCRAAVTEFLKQF